jgi:uncharacterized protein
MQWDVRIPMRDGIELSGILYLPQRDARPVPAIFAMTCYVAQAHHEVASYFAIHGYPFLTVDVRGRGNSDGTFAPHKDEGRDGYDIVAWLSGQPWCSGKVAMYGGSYLGYCQWAVARERPPHLAAIIPVASPYYGVDFPLRGNVFMSYTTQWMTLVSGRASQGVLFADRNYWRGKFKRWAELGAPFKDLDTLVGNPSATFQEWISHPDVDDYWHRRSPSPEQYGQITIPILTITGAYDGDQLGALEHYRRYMASASAESRARHYLVIGPWDHYGCVIPMTEFGGIKLGTACLVDLPLLHRQWYAWTMQGGPRPEFLRNKVAYYVIGAERWRYADSLDAITARSVPLYLHSAGNPTDVFRSGSLVTEQRPAIEPDHYVYDPRDVSLAELEVLVDPQSLVDQRLVNAAVGKQLVYHSEAFSQDTEISGFFQLSLWLSIDQPDTDFRATIYEVSADGSVVQLTMDWLRARYRESTGSARLIDTADPLQYDFKHFTFVARRLQRGSRLRLVVGPLDSIYLQRNYNTGGDLASESREHARPVTVRLFHDRSRPSLLHVPYGHPDEADAASRDG